MSKYQQFGGNDPLMQAIIQSMVATTKRTISALHHTYELDAAIAMLTTAIGVAVGECQAIRAKHNEECEECAKHPPAYYELAVKNFGAGFGQGKQEVEQEHASAASQADELLAKVLKGHGK